LSEKEEMRRDITTRSVFLTPSTANAEERSVEAVLTTENEAVVWDWERWEPIREILMINGMKMDGDQIPMLDSHLRRSNDDLLGSIRNIRKETAELVGKLVFADDGDKAERTWKKAMQGHLKDVSVGYRVDEKVDLNEGAAMKVGEREFVNSGKGILRISKSWTLKEASPTPIGADSKAKIRQDDSDKKVIEKPETIKIEEKKNMEEEKINVEEVKTKSAADAVTKERKRIDEISKLGELFEMPAEAQKAIREGTELHVFQALANDKLKEKKVIDSQRNDLDLSKKDVKNYSLSRAILGFSEKKLKDIAPFEAECSMEMEKKLGKKANGFFIPPEVIRALSTSGATAGLTLVGTDHLGGSFIDMLRERSKILALGVESLNGLVGDVSIPKQTGAGTVEHVTEGSTGTYGDQTFSSVTMSPYTLRGNTAFSRELLAQSNPSVDRLIMVDLAREFALKVDEMILNGTGSGEPTGIINTSLIGAVDGASFGWEQAVELETDVLGANGDVGSLSLVCRPSVMGLLKTRDKADGAAKFIWEGNSVNAYNSVTTTKCPASTIVFGAYAAVLLGFWGGFDLISDPYTAIANGRINIWAFQMYDIAVRHAGAFSVATSVS
jgi:HK97 family phage major capsid protein